MKKNDIHMDASDYHLEEVISQEGKPINFYSPKLTAPQKRDTVTEKELPNIIKTLKYSCKVFLRQDIKIILNIKI